MKVVLPDEMRDIEEYTIQNIGIPGIVLMECAALKVVEEITKMLEGVSEKEIVVFAGKGNNGGDAFAVARHLFGMGAHVLVFLAAPRDAVRGDAAVNLHALDKMGVPVLEVPAQAGFDEVSEAISGSRLVVDGIFGTGIRGAVTGIPAGIIDRINQSGKKVLAIDIPSGVDGGTGKVPGSAVRAHVTVTFGFPKLGITLVPGLFHAGRIVVADIGIPHTVTKDRKLDHNLLDQAYLSTVISRRQPETNKGNYGRVLVAGGSTGLTGSVCLTSLAALRTGSGLVTLAVPASLHAVFEVKTTEVMTVPVEDEGDGYFSLAGLTALEELIKKADVLAVGPGMTTKGNIPQIISNILTQTDIPIVIDADGLNAVSQDTGILKKMKNTAVITPHPGEMARLTGYSISHIQSNRLETAREFSGKWGVITVLKGYNTIIAEPGGEVFISHAGNPGMATGGTGDILAGIIASLIGQGIPPFHAAAAGVMLHGLSGDAAADRYGEHGMIAGDLLEELPGIIKRIAGR